MAEKHSTQSVSDGTPSVDIPVLGGTVGPEVIDVRALYGKTGKFTYDPGFKSTASCRSAITFIDGDEGILMYRGYPIEQLAETCTFLEVAYLIMNCELPTHAELDKFTGIVTHTTMMHDQVSRFYPGFRRVAQLLAVLCGVIGGLWAFYFVSSDINDPPTREVLAFTLIANLASTTALTYTYSLCRQ